MSDMRRVDTSTLVISRGKKKRHLTAEHKAKISAAKTDVPRDSETIEKIRATLKSKYAAGQHSVPRHETKYTKEEMLEMKQAYLNGTPVSELQKIYKLSRTTIYKYL
jgi:Mor family transcriptional regulator